MTERSNVVVVDSRPLFRHGVASALAGTRLFSVVGQGATSEDAVALVTKHAPALIIMDADLSNGDFGSVERVRAASPNTRIIVLTDVDERGLVEEALRVGVGGYLLKNIQGSELCQAASAVLAGEMFVCQALVKRLLRAAEWKPSDIVFSAREEQVLQLLVQGKSNKAIAFQLAVSEKTAKHYLTTLMKKLNARNRVQVALFAAGRKAPSRLQPSDPAQPYARADMTLA
jgi:DNA-binding NarL/FixJ family response regulator